ncbi:hypothetical protein [Ruegeria arenilitoris]|uniref:hypothetical protein n=1 Tax=Ruegeria arenilitoris TaxID=1173585 RepID=UPI00147CF796|nr:hypothetical protein [Ruegeria arenilitoris]
MAVTLSRDNNPTWIEDFAGYHRAGHGLQPFGTPIASSAWCHYDAGALSNCVIDPETQAAFANIGWAKTPAE